MSLDNLHPFSSQHAIESAAFALEFSSELDVGELTALRLAAANLSSDFPVTLDKRVTTVNFQVAPDSASASASEAQAGGFTMNRVAPSLPESPIRFIDVGLNGIVVVVKDYTRWDKFKSDIDRYLSALLAPIDSQKAVSSLGIQFNDIFLWKADPEELELSKVFSLDNPYIARNSFALPTSWHSHHGYLVSNTEPVQHLQLDNINVSRVVSNGTDQIQILTSHRVTLEKPLFKGWSAQKAILTTFQDKLHEQNKVILNNLLSPAAQLKINLNGLKES